MSTAQHRIARYHYAVDVTQDGLGRLTLWDAQGRQVAELACLEDGAVLPPPRIEPDLSHAAAFVHAGAMPALLDLLRHHGHVCLCLDNAPPGFVSFETADALGTHAPSDSATQRTHRGTP
jgi:hypothetical protein